MALAHTLENKTEEAYWRGDLFEKRVRAMGAWAEYLAQSVPARDAIPIRRNRVAALPKLKTDDEA